MGRRDLLGLSDPTFADCGAVWGRGRWVGGAGHELGHALGLSHPTGCNTPRLPTCDRGSLMSVGYTYWPETYLRQDKMAALRAGPFFRRLGS